jgi:regulator of ribonuclease activity A
MSVVFNLQTADLCDQYGEKLLCADPVFIQFGLKKTFFGEITTIKLFEDNSLVRERLNMQGYGKVLVIDGGGSTRCALVGDQLAELAIKNDWEGILVNGCIRDSFIINKMKISIKAINTSPVKSIKHLTGEYDIPVKFAGINFYPGHFLYSDEDGLLVSIEKLH